MSFYYYVNLILKYYLLIRVYQYASLIIVMLLWMLYHNNMSIPPIKLKLGWVYRIGTVLITLIIVPIIQKYKVKIKLL